MVMRGKPGNGRAFDETRSDAREMRQRFRIFLQVCDPPSNSLRALAGVARIRLWRNWPRLHRERAVIPLANVAAPILNGEIGGLVAEFECCPLVAVARCGEQVNTIEFSGRQLNGLTARDDGVG